MFMKRLADCIRDSWIAAASKRVQQKTRSEQVQQCSKDLTTKRVAQSHGKLMCAS